MPRLAANLSMMFAEHAFLDRFAAAAEAGFQAVEFLFPYEYAAAEIRARLDARGLHQALFNLHPGDWSKGERGLAIFPERVGEFNASLDQALAYAQVLGCPKLHVMAGILPEGASRARAEATYLANLAAAARLAGEHGVQLLIEPLNTRDMPGYFLTGTEEAARLIASVGSPHLRLQHDLYHRQIMGGDLATSIERHRDIIGHIQIAGVPGRHEPDVGEINYGYLFDLVDRVGYDGWIGCEYRPRAGTLAGLGWAGSYGIGAARRQERS